MKKIALFLFVALAAVFTSCEYDNYEEPNTTLTGKMVLLWRIAEADRLSICL